MSIEIMNCHLKCLPHGRPSVRQTSFLRVLVLKFKLYSDFPTYWDFWQSQPCIRQIMHLLLPVTLCLITKLFLLKALWKFEQDLSCLQHRLIDLVKQYWHFTLSNLISSKFSCYQKPFSIRFFDPNRFFFLFNAKIGGTAKISVNFDSICKICEFLSIIVLRSGSVLLYLTVSGKGSLIDVLISFSNSFLGIVIARLICV